MWNGEGKIKKEYKAFPFSNVTNYSNVYIYIYIFVETYKEYVIVVGPYGTSISKKSQRELYSQILNEKTSTCKE